MMRNQKGNTKKQRFLSFFMAFVMVLSFFPATLWTVAEEAEAATIGTATTLDIDFNWAEFEAMLNPAYTIREIDTYLRDMHNISNTPGVSVSACLGMEYRVTYEGTFTDDTEWKTDYFVNSIWSAGSTSNSAIMGLKMFYDSSFSKETLTKIKKTAKEDYDFYNVDNLTYRLIFTVFIDEEGALDFTTKTPLTINGTKFSPSYVRLGKNGGGSYHKDLTVHEATQARVSSIDVKLTQSLTTGYAAPGASFEFSSEKEIEPVRNLSDDGIAIYRIKPGVKYTLDVFVRQYGGIGFVDYEVEGLDTTGSTYSDIALEHFDGIEKTRASVYIDPKDKTDFVRVKFISVDDPSVTKLVDFYIADMLKISLDTYDNDSGKLHHKNYLDFDGSSRVRVEALPESVSRFDINGDMNDWVVDLQMTGNTKPITWFDTEKTSYGYNRTYLFSIDPKETSKHLVLTASLRSYPECKVECHYYLAPSWTTLHYQLDNVYTENILEYEYVAGEEFNFEDGAALVQQYIKQYGRYSSFDAENEVISGWNINGVFYAAEKPINYEGTAKTLLAKAVWVQNPIVRQPSGKKIDAASTEKNVPVSTAVKMDTSDVGDVAKLAIYLEKYDDVLGKWYGTKLIRTKRQALFQAVANSCLETAVDSDGFFTFQAGIEPSLLNYGTYRYRIVTEDERAFTTEPFRVNVKGILANPEDQTISCGGTASVTFAAEDTGVAKTKYEWWYYAHIGDGQYAWIKVEDFANAFPVKGYNTPTMTISAEKTDRTQYLMEGRVKCKLINAETDEVILESAEATIRHEGHAMSEPCKTDSTQTDHSIRCRYCHGISMIMRSKHNYRWVYSASDSTKVTHVCKDCGYIDINHKSTSLSSLQSNLSATLTLNSNDGTFMTRSVGGRTYQTVELKKYAFVNPGFIQVGWAFNSDAKEPDYRMDDRAVLDGMYDLYAIWKPITSVLVFDLIKNYDFKYGGVVTFNDASLENDDAFLNHYFDGMVEFQWVRYNDDGTNTVIGSDETFYFPKEDALELYVDSKIQLRIIDGDRMFVSTPFPFVAYTTYTLTGIVKDGKGVGIEDATIDIIDKKTGKSITMGHSGTDGVYRISDILQGSYTVQVNAFGYDPNTFALELYKDTAKTVKLVRTKLPFTDLTEGTWQYNTARFVYERKIIQGTSATTFSPNNDMTRAQFMVILWHMAGNPKVPFEQPFSDVAKSYFAATAIQWAKNQGLASGYSDGTFKPKEPMSREQFCAFMRNYAKYLGQDVSTHGTTYTECSDADKVSKTFRSAVQWAYERGLIAANGKLSPKNNITRIQAAAVLQRFINYYNIP